MTKPKHLLTVVADHEGQVYIHADSAGLDYLITALQGLKAQVDEGHSDHDHLMSESWAGAELSENAGLKPEGSIVHHVKVYGWTKEGLKANGFIQ